jgi:hypothetical protein
MDGGLEPGVTYSYRLLGRSRTGEEMVLGQIAAASERILRFALTRAWPNPTREGVHVGFAVPRESRVRLRVLDIQGREVAVLSDGRHRPGRYHAAWNGQTSRGLPVPSGVYFLQFSSSAANLSQRIVIVR